MVWVVVIHLFGFVHQKLTEIIGETWGSFFLSLSFPFSNYFLFFKTLFSVSIFLFNLCLFHSWSKVF